MPYVSRQEILLGRIKDRRTEGVKLVFRWDFHCCLTKHLTTWHLNVASIAVGEGHRCSCCDKTFKQKATLRIK